MPSNQNRHVIVTEWADIDAAPQVSDRDKQRVATIFSEQSWAHVVWIPAWVLDDADKDIETVESSEHLAVGRVDDYSEDAWRLRQTHLSDGYPPKNFLPKSAVVVFKRLLEKGETIETPQQGLDAFAGVDS